MDSTLSLFGTEFSLFSEDLLFSPTVPVNEGVAAQPQDGLKVTSLSDALAQPAELTTQGLGVLGNKEASGNLLEEWLDTRIDLLDLVSEQTALPGSEVLMDIGLEMPTEDSPGLLALRIEAERTSLELSTDALQEPVVISPELPSQGSDNVYDQGLGLLELLTSSVSQKQALEVGDLAGLDLGVDMDTSEPLLSPVTPEDVETILSSGPASPESLVTEESFESLMSTVMASDSSFNDSSNREEVSLVEDYKQPIDLALLSHLVSVNQTSDDTSSESDAENCPANKQTQRRSSKKKETSENALGKIHDKKLRKKQQNKDAATRYRQKKKMEQDLVNREVALLEGRNTELKDKVEQMTKEIQYLKTLLTDVYKARSKNTKSK